MNSASRRNYLLAASVALITFAVYLPALRNGFVTWDDDIYVFENYHILSLNAAFFRWAFFDFHASNWHPLTWISHALDYAVWGLNPLGHHLTNNVLHAVNAFLVALLAGGLLRHYRERITRSGQTSFLSERAISIAVVATGLLFGLHPVRVESVAWVSERKDLLCALFVLLSCMAYMRYAGGRRHAAGNTQPATNVRNRAAKKHTLRADKRQAAIDNQQFPAFFADKHYVAALVFFILALMSKPMAVSLPIVLLILDWHPFGRIRSVKTVWSPLVEKIPFIALSLGSSIVTMLAQKTGGAMKALEFVPLSVRLPVAAKSLVAYLGKMLWPFDLNPYYLYPQDASFLAFGYFFAIVLASGITIACVVLAEKHKLWLAAWGVYSVMLLPVLGIVQVGIQAMADRYTYLPSLGPFLVLGLGAAWLSERAFSGAGRELAVKIVSGVAAITLLGLLSFLTVKQTRVWENSMTLWGYVIEKTDQKVPFAYMNRGVAFEKAGFLDKAISDYNATIVLDPEYSQAYANRAVAYEKAGRFDQALEDYKRAVALDPSSAQTHFNLGSFYLGSGRLGEAMEQYNQAIVLNPGHADAHLNRGVILSEVGQPGKALDDYNRAIALNPNNDLAYFNRGNLFLEFRDTGRARADFRKACELGYQGGCGALQALQ
jgi:Tfp pilus assembly protein PilF